MSETSTRDRILSAAAELFAGRGYAATSIRHICERAGANVASVNYYFRSKEHLYEEVFRMLFETIASPLEEIARRRIETATQWREAIHDWILKVLGIFSAEDPPQRWAAKLFARERVAPSSVFPIVYGKFFHPLEKALEDLIRLALARRRSEYEVRKWILLIGGACDVFAYHDAPWDEVVFPAGVEKQEWLRQVAEHLTGVVCCGLPEKGSPLDGEGPK